jgi:hypothetical protein
LPAVPKPSKKTQPNKEAFKQGRYRAAERAMAKRGHGGQCVLCLIRVPGGSAGISHHEILPKSELPGEKNLERLYSLSNVALACPEHHHQLQSYRLIWMKAMVRLGIAAREDYVETKYWSDEKYPITQECYGDFGYGSNYFRRNPMIESLERLYARSFPNFDQRWFCGFCPVRVMCARKQSRNNDFPL